MRAIMVAVDYTDLLKLTLPYNRGHFEEMWVVTDYQHDHHKVARLCEENEAECIKTDLFYANGATFNKWRALEWGLDAMGRHGWLCIMDADVLWPKKVSLLLESSSGLEYLGDPRGECGNARGGVVHQGQLCTPKRRMWEDWPKIPQHCHIQDVGGKDEYCLVPEEREWFRFFPLHRQQKEFAGYTQIFHADDPVLRLCGNCQWPAEAHGKADSGNPCKQFAWHQTDWKHAGGADSFFQAKWSESRKVRPPFEVLHLGPAGQNWFGRASKFADGSDPADAVYKLNKIRKIWTGRAENRRAGRDQFEGERLGSEKRS